MFIQRYFQACFGRGASLESLSDEAYKASPEAIQHYQTAKRYQQKRDEPNYVKYVTLAAEMQLADAQVSLGSSYLYGMYVPEDRTEGRKWMQLAANQGSIVAQQYLNCLDNLPPESPFPTSAQHGNNVTFMTGFPK